MINNRLNLHGLGKALAVALAALTAGCASDGSTDNRLDAYLLGQTHARILAHEDEDDDARNGARARRNSATPRPAETTEEPTFDPVPPPNLEGVDADDLAAAPGVRSRPAPITDAATTGNGHTLGAGETPIAYVDDIPISRDRLVDLLLAAHGPGLLEQVIVLERAKEIARQRGISVSEQDVRTEYDRGLRRLLSPIESADDSGPFDRAEAEKVLDEILARRNISRKEYMSSVRRNAWLRALIAADMEFTEEQLKTEYDRVYGERVQVRHIQLPSLRDADLALSRIQRGADFASLARQYSANARTGADGGLLPPFGRDDPEAPAAFRDTAFDLAEGEISKPIRDDNWYHIIKVEKRLAPEDVPFDDAVPQLLARLRKRTMEPAMQALYQALFQQARVQILDGTLREAFEARHPNHGQAPTAAGF